MSKIVISDITNHLGRESKLTHGNAQETDSNLYARNDDEDSLDATLCEPAVGSKSKAKREDVLEDEEAREGFDGDIT